MAAVTSAGARGSDNQSCLWRIGGATTGLAPALLISDGYPPASGRSPARASVSAPVERSKTRMPRTGDLRSHGALLRTG
jgi:hypothetical protein